MKLSPTKDNRTTNNFSTPCETENFDEDLNKNETNYSDFQKELQAQMKTPIQINNEKRKKRATMQFRVQIAHIFL